MEQEQPVEEKKQEGIILPTEPEKASRINIGSLCIYGLPKSGKTTALSELPNCLIIDTEKGSEFVGGLKMIMPEEFGPVAKFKWLRDIAAEIKKQGRPYDYVAIDTFSELDNLSEWVGTWNYMNSVIGKNFNRDANGNMLKPTDSSYQSVLNLPGKDGFSPGYKWTRDAILGIFEDLKGLGKICTIFVCHVSDKMVAKGTNKEVMTKDLALTGKVRDIIPRVVDATANVWNEDGKFMISFIGNVDKIGGVRAPHLAGYSGPLDWSKIFITEEEEVKKEKRTKS